jgi:hypothetical protein
VLIPEPLTKVQNQHNARVSYCNHYIVHGWTTSLSTGTRRLFPTFEVRKFKRCASKIRVGLAK